MTELGFAAGLLSSFPFSSVSRLKPAVPEKLLNKPRIQAFYAHISAILKLWASAKPRPPYCNHLK